MSPDDAWQAYRLLRSNRLIGFLAEPNELPETWQTFTRGFFTSSNLWTDAYLLAFASAAGFTLVTFDAKIPNREGQNRVLLR